MKKVSSESKVLNYFCKAYSVLDRPIHLFLRWTSIWSNYWWQ